MQRLPQSFDVSLTLRRIFLSVSFDCELSFLWKIGETRIFSKKPCFLKSDNSTLEIEESLISTFTQKSNPQVLFFSFFLLKT